MSVSMLEDKPCYVTFETRAVEDRNVLIDEGHYGYKDVIFVQVMQPGGKEVFEDIAHEWLEKQVAKVRKKDLPLEIYNVYKQAFEAYKLGEELPVNGTPIKSWPMLTPAQIKMVLQANVRTVQDLANANEDAIAAIGMGARSFKEKAKIWLESANQGKVTNRIADLERSVSAFENRSKEDREYIELLEMKLKSLEKDDGPKEKPAPKKKGKVDIDMDDL